MIKKLKEIIESVTQAKVFIAERGEMNVLADEIKACESFVQIVPTYRKDLFFDVRRWEKATIRVYFSKFVQLECSDKRLYEAKCEVENDIVLPLFAALRNSNELRCLSWHIDYSVPPMYDANEATIFVEIELQRPVC